MFHSGMSLGRIRGFVQDILHMRDLLNTQHSSFGLPVYTSLRRAEKKCFLVLAGFQRGAFKNPQKSVTLNDGIPQDKCGD